MSTPMDMPAGEPPIESRGDLQGGFAGISLTGPLTVRWATGERTFEPGAVVTIGRDLMADVVLSNRNVSRYHAKAETRADGRWVLTDLGSSQGSYLYGARTYDVVIDNHTIVLLGRAPDGEAVELLAHAGPPVLM